MIILGNNKIINHKIYTIGISNILNYCKKKEKVYKKSYIIFLSLNIKN